MPVGLENAIMDLKSGLLLSCKKLKGETIFFKYAGLRYTLKYKGYHVGGGFGKADKRGVDCTLYTSRRIMNWGWVQNDRKVGASRLVHALEINTDLEFTRRVRLNWGVA